MQDTGGGSLGESAVCLPQPPRTPPSSLLQPSPLRPSPSQETASTEHEWLAFAILLPLAAIAPLFRVPVGRNHSLHAAPAFVVAGALVLPPLLVVALVLALHAPLAIRDRYPWYIQTFNIANFTLSGLAAWLAVETINRNGDLGFAVSGLVAAGVFVVVNHGLLAVMLRLGRGHSFRETGLFSASGLGIEFVIAALGVAVAAFATVNPWLLPAVLAPLALAHRSLSTTALLRETEERFRTMFESAPTATMLFATGGEVMAANRSALSLFGYERARRSSLTSTRSGTRTTARRVRVFTPS